MSLSDYPGGRRETLTLVDARRKGGRMATPEEQLAEATKQIETLTTQLADASKGADEGLRTQLTDLEKLNKELIAGRDKAKEDKRKAEEDKLTENAEFKTLAENRATEITDLAGKLEAAKGTLEGYTERDKARLADLIEKVPENLRGTINNESLPLATQLELAEKLITEKPAGPGARPGGDGKTSSISRADFDTKTQAERSSFMKDGGTVHD